MEILLEGYSGYRALGLFYTLHLPQAMDDIRDRVGQKDENIEEGEENPESHGGVSLRTVVPIHIRALLGYVPQSLYQVLPAWS
jgi:hypothetical protein